MILISSQNVQILIYKSIQRNIWRFISNLAGFNESYLTFFLRAITLIRIPIVGEVNCRIGNATRLLLAFRIAMLITDCLKDFLFNCDWNVLGDTVFQKTCNKGSDSPLSLCFLLGSFESQQPVNGNTKIIGNREKSVRL